MFPLQLPSCLCSMTSGPSFHLCDIGLRQPSAKSFLGANSFSTCLDKYFREHMHHMRQMRGTCGV